MAKPDYRRVDDGICRWSIFGISDYRETRSFLRLRRCGNCHVGGGDLSRAGRRDIDHRLHNRKRNYRLDYLYSIERHQGRRKNELAFDRAYLTVFWQSRFPRVEDEYSP